MTLVCIEDPVNNPGYWTLERSVSVVAECGDIFCESCGDCSACYGGDGCGGNEGLGHIYGFYLYNLAGC